MTSSRFENGDLSAFLAAAYAFGATRRNAAATPRIDRLRAKRMIRFNENANVPLSAGFGSLPPDTFRVGQTPVTEEVGPQAA
jgi:hypothetical protein